MSQIAELLERAAGRLESKGWMQCADGNVRGPNCLRGALHWEAAAMLQPVLPETELILDASEKRYDLVDTAMNIVSQKVGTSDVVGWNDRAGRTAAEVIDVLKSGAKDLRNAAVPA